MERPLRIEGEQVFLRPLTPEDATQRYCAWLNDPRVTEHLVTVRTTIYELKKYIEEKNSKKDSIFLGIFSKQTNEHIGNIKLEPIDLAARKAMMGIIIGETAYWNKGIGSQTIKLFSKWVFEHLGIDTIEAGVFPENKASQRAFEKAGFVFARFEPQSVLHKGKMWDNNIFVLLRGKNKASY